MPDSFDSKIDLWYLLDNTLAFGFGAVYARNPKAKLLLIFGGVPKHVKRSYTTLNTPKRLQRHPAS